MDCRIPRTATRRRAITYTKLLDRVDPRARDGFGFEGRFLAPGSHIDDSELNIAKGRNAILLECTDIEGEWNVAHKRASWIKCYILWRWDTATLVWIEIARCQSNAGEWAEVLREPARIALGRESWSVVPSVALVSERIRLLLENELSGLEPGQEGLVLAELHDQLAVRIVRVA